MMASFQRVQGNGFTDELDWDILLEGAYQIVEPRPDRFLKPVRSEGKAT
jgi:hypothetical protein